MAGSKVHHGYFYSSDQEFTTRLTRIVRDSLADNRLTMLFLTREHKDLLEASLLENGIDVKSARDVRIFDAMMLKERLIESGSINAERFNSTFASLLRESAETNKEITVCGEIVNLLWKEGNTAAALQLEELWDNIISQYELHIHCAYDAPTDEAQRYAFRSVDTIHARHCA